MSRRYVTAAVIVVLAVMAAVFINVGSGDSYAYAGGEMKPAKPAAPIELLDQDGRPFSLNDYKGHVVLLYFGYTTCPDVCPTTLSDFSAVKDDLGDLASRVNFVMITVDPERDTADVLKKYLGFWDEGFIGVRGDRPQTDAVEAAYGVVATRVEYPESATKYLYDHTALIYVIDTKGNLKLSYPYGSDPALISKDLKHLLS